MSYLAIARKYRPDTFDQIVGQEHVTRTLRNAIESGRIHHAFLFCGARGVGKTTAARALARALNCTEGPTPDPCGSCTSCVEIGSGTHPDLIEIDGASNNSVDDVRDLRDTVHYSPNHGKYKIYLVDEVHMLSKAAFNALLKTLEEPPPHVVFIFATTEPNKILDTILSRVQRFDFKRIGVGPVVARLKEITEQEGATLSEDALRRIARAGEGSMRDAQSLLDKVISFSASNEVSDAQVSELLGLIDRDLLFNMADGLIDGRPEDCLDAIAQVYEYGFELSQFTTELMEVLRNAALVQMSPAARKHLDVSADELERLESLTDGVEAEDVSRLFSAVVDVHDKVARSTRPRLVLEMAVARLANTRKLHPVAALLGRLELLERKLGASGGSSGSGGLRGGASRGPRNRGGRRGPPGGHRAAPAGRRPPPPEPLPERVVQPPPTDRPEPPPIEEAPALSPEEAAGLLTDAASTNEAWERLCRELKRIRLGAEHIAEGPPARRGEVLRVTVAAGLRLSQARRAAAEPEVRQVLRECYGPSVRLELVPALGTGSARDQQEALKIRLLEDPQIRRLVDTLGATVEHVAQLDEGDSA